jgi:hypothetical protein
MAFSDDLARDPKSEKEFWTIVEDTFVQVQEVLAGHPVETREEALVGTLRGGDFRDPEVSIIRYRGVNKDIDNRDYFLELGRELLPKVEQQIRARKLTPKFAKDWGVVMMSHGFISAHILDDSDGLFHVRANQLSLRAQNKYPQKKWVARQILGFMKPGPRHLSRTLAEARLAEELDRLIEKDKFPIGFDRRWFDAIRKHGALRDAYSQKRLSMAHLRELASQPSDDIPPINFSR